MKNILLHAGALIFFILLAHAAGFLGSFFTIPNIESWYELLNKPPLTPPNWVFGPVWLTLYTLMGIASYVVWKTKGEGYKRALWLYEAHLVVNAAWSVVFFGEQNVGMALGIIVLLDVLLIEIIRRFWRVSKTAGILLIPYLLWALFATYLNTAIFFLN